MLTERSTLDNLVQRAMRAEIERMVIEEAEEAAKRVRKRVQESAAILATKVLERYTMERFGSTLRIEVNLNEYGKQ